MAHVEKRGPGRWRARYRGPDGRERSRTFERKGDAERWLTAIENAKLWREWIDPRAGQVLLADFAAEWMAGIVHLRPSTRHRYESLLRVHIGPALGQAPLNTIRPQDVRTFVSGMLRVLSPTTARHAFVLLSEILRAAQRDGRIARNPAADVRPPARGRQEQRFLSAEQVWTLAESIRPRYRSLVLLGAYGALRWGELAGLRVTRLRLLERKVDVSESLVEVGSRIVSGPPKTGARTASIPAPLVEELAHHLAAFPPGPDGLVFTGPLGQPLRHPNFYRREWQPSLERARLDSRLRIHDLRHTAVALAIAAGAHAKEIQELCGHASILTTFNVYGHLLEGLQERLADRLGQTFLEARAAALRPERGPAVSQLHAVGGEIAL